MISLYLDTRTHTHTHTHTHSYTYLQPAILPNASVSVPMTMERHIQQTNERLLVSHICAIYDLKKS